MKEVALYEWKDPTNEMFAELLENVKETAKQVFGNLRENCINCGSNVTLTP